MIKQSGVIYDSSLGKTSGTVYIETPVLRRRLGCRAPYRAHSSLSRWRVVCRAGALPSSWAKRLFALTGQAGLARYPAESGILRAVRASILGSELTRSFVRGIANGLIIFSLVGFLLIFGPLLPSEIKYRVSRVSHFDKEKPPSVHFSDLIKSDVQAQGLIIPEGNFAIVISKINAQAVVIPNVDASSPVDYHQALLQGVAHAKGTVLPGMKGYIYLFAHSASDNPFQIARYNAVFYLLRELEEGDEVIVYFYGGQHTYKVFKKEILPPSDTRYFEKQEEEEILVLQTCWPPGTTLKQLVVLAKKDYSI